MVKEAKEDANTVIFKMVMSMSASFESGFIVGEYLLVLQIALTRPHANVYLHKPSRIIFYSIS